MRSSLRGFCFLEKEDPYFQKHGFPQKEALAGAQGVSRTTKITPRQSQSFPKGTQRNPEDLQRHPKGRPKSWQGRPGGEPRSLKDENVKNDQKNKAPICHPNGNYHMINTIPRLPEGSANHSPNCRPLAWKVPLRSKGGTCSRGLVLQSGASLVVGG